MFKNKKLTIAVLLALAIIAIILFLWPKQKSSLRPTSELPKPKIETAVNTILAVESHLSADKVKIPPRLPVYTVGTTAISLEDSSAIATNFGFTTAVQVLADARFGPTYIWSESNIGNLRIVPVTHIVDYKAPFIAVSKNKQFESEKEIISKARRFLISRSLENEDKLLSPKIRYLTTTDESYIAVEKNLADLIDITFPESINNYQVVNPTTEVGTINIKLNRDSDVISVYLDKTSQIISSADYAVKTFSELTASLSAAKIQSLDNGVIDPTAVSTSINKVVIENATIAYYQELSAKQQYLQPIFVLDGTAVFKTGQAVPVILYLPALAESSK